MKAVQQALGAGLHGERTTTSEEHQRTFLHEWLEAQADRTPQRRAVGFEGRWLTYQELDDQANRLAIWLREQGIGPEAVVGLCLDRSLEMVVGLFGVLKAGGAYLPMDPTLPRARLQFMVQDAGATVVLADRKSAGLFSARQVLCLDEPVPSLRTASHGRPVSGVIADNLAYVIYTSGSTGVPKGVMMSHRGIQRLAYDLRTTVIGQNPFPTVVTLNAPVFFDGSIKQLCWMAGGASMVIVPDSARHDPELLLDLLRAERVDLMDCTPALLEMISLLVGIGELPAGLRLLIGGEAISRKLWSALRNGRLEAYNMYGPTESNAVTVMWIDGAAEPVIGRPLPGYHTWIIDESGSPVPPGTAGELVVSGDGIARGYHNRPRLTAERFAATTFAPEGRRGYRTGDICRELPSGTIEFVGRRDTQVKLRGYRIELSEVEAALLRRPEISACAVVLRESPSGNKRLIGYFVSAVQVPEADLVSELCNELPAYMIPARLVWLNRLPVTSNGKIDHAALPKPS